MNALTQVLVAIFLVACCDDFKSIEARYNATEGAQKQHEFFRLLFKDSKLSDLIELTHNGNDSVATQSAWELTQEGVRTREWFVGFFEGRNRVTPPSWWRKVITEPQHFRRLNITPVPYHRASVAQVACPADSDVTEEEGVVTYHFGEEKFVIPEELLERNEGLLSGNYSCAFTGKHCYISSHDDAGSSQTLSCLERGTNRIVWSQNVCSCSWGSSTGIHVNWVALVTTSDERIFVFGSASAGFYVHGFDASNGKTIMQFVSSY